MDSKVCPKCKENKLVDEFHTYFSKQRNKYRISNYCKPCGRKSSNERAKDDYKKNKEKKLKYAKEYRIKNKDSIRVKKQVFRNKYIKELHDLYVMDLLRSKNGIPTKELRENPEIIELKRNLLMLKRKVYEKQNNRPE